MDSNRRKTLKKLIVSTSALAGFSLLPGFSSGNSRFSDHSAAFVPHLSISNSQEDSLESETSRYNNLLYVSAIRADNLQSGIKEQTEDVLKKMEIILWRSGSSMERVFKVNVFLDDISFYEPMNEVYYKEGRFGKKGGPSRSTVAVAKGGIPSGALVQMNCVARL